MTDGSGQEPSGEPSAPPAPLLDALRELSERGAAEYLVQAQGTYGPEPLMERIERDRRQRRTSWIAVTAGLAIFVVSCLAVGVAGLVSWLRAIGLGLRAGTITLGGPGPSVVVPFAVGALCAWVGLVWLRPVDLRRVARAYAAHPAAPGEVPVSARALDEVIPAFGLAVAPPLLVVDAPTLNAFSAGRLETGVVAVTRGLAEAMPADEQRAVFAHLLVRLVLGGAPSAQGEPSVEEQADVLAMHAMRDPHAILTSLERLTGADTTLLPGRSGWAPAVHFFAPQMPTCGVTDKMRAVQLDVRISRMRAVLGAAAVGE